MVDENQNTKCAICGEYHDSPVSEQEIKDAIMQIAAHLGFPLQETVATSECHEEKPDETLQCLQRYIDMLADAYDAVSTVAYAAYMDGEHEINVRAQKIAAQISDLNGIITARIHHEQEQQHVA